MWRSLSLLLLALASPAAATLPAIDDFNRGSLGGNWTNVALNGGDPSDGCTIVTNALTGTGLAGDNVSCFWNPDSIATASYACGPVVGTNSPTGAFGETGVCLGVDALGSEVCCVEFYDPTTPSNDYWVMYANTSNPNCTGVNTPFTCCTGAGTGTCNGSTVGGTNGCTTDCVTNNFPPGTYIGIERADATTFECFRSTDGMTWAGLGGTATVLGITNPGQLGAWGSVVQAASTTVMLDAWEGGNGLLPTARVCTVSPATTTATGTGTTSTTTTSTTVTTTSTATTSTAASTSTTTTTVTTTSTTTTTFGPCISPFTGDPHRTRPSCCMQQPPTHPYRLVRDTCGDLAFPSFAKRCARDRKKCPRTAFTQCVPTTSTTTTTVTTTTGLSTTTTTAAPTTTSTTTTATTSTTTTTAINTNEAVIYTSLWTIDGTDTFSTNAIQGSMAQGTPVLIPFTGVIRWLRCYVTSPAAGGTNWTVCPSISNAPFDQVHFADVSTCITVNSVFTSYANFSGADNVSQGRLLTFHAFPSTGAPGVTTIRCAVGMEP